MKVHEMVKLLSKVKNQNSEITLMGNLGNSEDGDDDFYFDKVEVWEDGEDSITLFLCLNKKSMTTKITKDDVQFVCGELNIQTTPEMIDFVMENYESGLSNDPEENYFFIVEDLVYNYLNNQ